MNQNSKETTGAFVGAAQVVVGHPFDTAKVMMQNRKIGFGQLPAFKLSTYYRGLSLPLCLNSVVNSVFFSVEHQTYNWLQSHHSRWISANNHLISGFTAGIIGSAIICPADNYKCKKQLKSTMSFRMYRGLHGTMLREGPCIMLYFQAYFFLRPYRNMDYPYFSNFLAGALTGLVSWSLYPLDTVKTRVQTTEMGLYKALITPGLWNGFRIAWTRAFFVNGCGFMVYEHLIDPRL